MCAMQDVDAIWYMPSYIKNQLQTQDYFRPNFMLLWSYQETESGHEQTVVTRMTSRSWLIRHY
jgi:hypothetical protein